MSGRIRAVIFDLDGTLVETHTMAVSLIGEAIRSYGGPDLRDEEVIALFGRNERGIFRDAIGIGWEDAWQFYLDSYLQRHQAAAEPFPGIADLLDRLVGTGHHLGVITAKTLTTGNLSLSVLGLDSYFSEVRGGGMDTVMKSTQIGELAGLWGVDRGSVAYVGDTATDVTEARKAGVIAVAAGWSAYADFESLRAAEPDVHFGSVGELTEWLEQLPG